MGFVFSTVFLIAWPSQCPSGRRKPGEFVEDSSPVADPSGRVRAVLPALAGGQEEDLHSRVDVRERPPASDRGARDSSKSVLLRVTREAERSAAVRCRLDRETDLSGLRPEIPLSDLTADCLDRLPALIDRWITDARAHAAEPEATTET